MHLFYTPLISGSEHELDKEEARHCAKVLRLSNGDEVRLTDGKGRFYDALISDISGKYCKLRIKSKTEIPRPNFGVHIAVAPTKNINRYEWFLEKATEIGVDRIIPILCSNSERKIIKKERLEKIIVAAMKQSHRAWLPEIEEMVDFESLVKHTNADEKFIAHCNDIPEQHLINTCPKGKNVVVLIGPEGDFSPKEVELALTNGFIPISLGNNRLRTETAALAACHIVNLVNV